MPFENLPTPNDAERAQEAKKRHDQMHDLASVNGPAHQENNGEEDVYTKSQLTSFTKGLPHKRNGLASRDDYTKLVNALNAPDYDFDVPAGSIAAADLADLTKKAERKWESPVSGHFYDTQGVDPDGLTMAPAPKLGLSELCAEMALVYLMALLRDEPLNKLHDPDHVTRLRFPNGHAKAGDPIRMQDILHEMKKLSWLNPEGTPTYANRTQNNPTAIETARRKSLWEVDGTLTLRSAFRGSTKGAKQGDYLSQFMLVGTQNGRHMQQIADGVISFGTNTIDQRVAVTESGRDYMQGWEDWLAIQNGKNPSDGDAWQVQRQFINTLRNLADYVHVDQLYQAYFNACLILLGQGAPNNPGFPTTSVAGEVGPGRRSRVTTGFAQFGGPHILSLMTEVATRGLKAVRRQKFQIHRRARPEVIAARLTSEANGFAKPPHFEPEAIAALKSMREELEGTIILALIAEMNAQVHPGPQPIEHGDQIHPSKNYLLPMAFPEGSPMHAAYGAGHATVAGACVTMLKAFFDHTAKMEDVLGSPHGFEPNPSNGLTLRPGAAFDGASVADELDKLAANVSIGRNMAGVHYHSDYFDSLRLGERVAVSLLYAQMLCYPEEVEITLSSFDHDEITLWTSGTRAAADQPVDVQIKINGDPDAYGDWWSRHFG